LYGAWVEEIVITEKPSVFSLRQGHRFREVMVDAHIRALAEVTKPGKFLLVGPNDLLGIVRGSAV
jgi:hypothetical protein